jgi:hypothetical protein
MFPLLLVCDFEASTKLMPGTSYRSSRQLSAVSSQLANQRCQQAFHFNDLAGKTVVISDFQELQITSQQTVVLPFAGRPHRNLHKPAHIGIALPQHPSAMFAPIDAEARRI